MEKPLAQSAADAERVVQAAEDAGRTLMVGHLLEYHPGLEMLNEMAAGGELGDIHYIYGNRLNLGKLRAEENALWSLGAHDVSVLLRLAGEEPYEIQARGESYMRPGVEDVVFCFLRFPSGLAAHLHLSWLDPHKERRFTVVGSKRMATFDDMELERKLTVYDKGFDQDVTSYGEYITRSGDICSPRDPQRGAAADRVPALRRRRARRHAAALGRAQRPARRARAGGAAAVAGGEPSCCARLTARPGCCSARACASPTRRSFGGNVGDPRGHGAGRGRGDPGRRGGRQAAGLGPRSTARRERAAADPRSARARPCARAPWWWRARRSGPGP